jgi:hypothetical protein
VVRLKQDFQQRIREAEALKLDLAKAEATIAAATGGGWHRWGWAGRVRLTVALDSSMLVIV